MTVGKYYPILVAVEDQDVVVVGGGKVAQRKVESLLGCGARISVVSKDLTDKLKSLVDIGKLRYLGPRFFQSHLKNASLVFVTTDDKELNHRVATAAQSRGLLVNVADQPQDCTFILPAVLKRGDLVVGISTSGKSPALAKKLRKDLESYFGPEYELFVALMGRLREKLLSLGLTQEENSRIFHQIVDSDILVCLRKRDWNKVLSIMKAITPQGVSCEEILNHLNRDRG